MPDQVLLEFYEQRPSRFSSFSARVKVAEIDAGHMTVPQLEKLFQIQEMLGRTYEIKRIGLQP